MERPTCAVALIFQYQTIHGEKRTDKGGKATLYRSRDNRLFLLTVKQVATYAEIRDNETINTLSIPLLRAVRGDKKLMYKPVLKDVPVPIWTQVDVSEEDPKIPVSDEKFIDVSTHDVVYYLEVTGEAWAESPTYQPITSSTVNISLGDIVRFGAQRKMGTGFLSEFPQWRSIREVQGKSTNYPGAGNQWYTTNSPFQIPPTNNPDCKGAQISFCFPSSVLMDWCYYPPMFLLDVNIKSAAIGWPVINDQNELIGVVSQPIYVMDTKDLCFPGTWVCAIPADIVFGPSPNKPEKKEEPATEPSPEDTPASTSGTDAAATTVNPKPKPKAKANKKKKKGKKK